MNHFQDARVLSHSQAALAPGARSWPALLQSGVASVVAYWANRRQRARELQDLHSFSDRELWDIGLGRSDLHAISQGTYRRD